MNAGDSDSRKLGVLSCWQLSRDVMHDRQQLLSCQCLWSDNHVVLYKFYYCCFVVIQVAAVEPCHNSTCHWVHPRSTSIRSIHSNFATVTDTISSWKRWNLSTSVLWALYTLSQKKVAHHSLRNIFAQGWPTAKISTAAESQIIGEHKFVINVLIFNVPKFCHLAN